MFHPWIGSEWGHASNALGGARLLVVGESHYCSHEHPELVGQCLQETTAEVVESLAISGPHRFFTGLTQLVSGRQKRSMSQGEVRALWHALAFYNYVPVFVATGPRVRPTPAMFESGRAPFNEVISRLEPQAIVVCGMDLWWWLRRGLSESGFGSAPAVDGCWIGRALAARVKHPSAIGFSWVKERPVIESLLAHARGTTDPRP